MEARVDNFLDHNDVVGDMPSLNETSLILRYYGGENLLDPIGNYFGDEFIPNVAKRNRFESVKGGGPFFFGNQRKKG